VSFEDYGHGYQDWHCAHCGKRSGMYGHSAQKQDTPEGLCITTLRRNDDGTYSGFYCEAPHTCRTGNGLPMELITIKKGTTLKLHGFPLTLQEDVLVESSSLLDEKFCRENNLDQYIDRAKKVPTRVSVDTDLTDTKAPGELSVSVPPYGTSLKIEADAAVPANVMRMHPDTMKVWEESIKQASPPLHSVGYKKG
jgi:hypothetical protein